MQYLGLLDRLFPTATYAHLIRDGRDAAMSYLTVPAGIMTESWGHPRDVTGFACQWRTEVAAARTLGRTVGPSRYLELRYESFVGDPEGQLRRLCSFAGLPYEPSMLEYVGAVDVSEKPHQRSLTMAPTPGLRDWRADMDAADVTAFERVAGDLLAELDYELADRETARGPGLGARMALAAYAAKGAAWRGAASGLQRSPLWRRRHPVLS